MKFLSPTISEARGSVGALTYSKNRNGNYTKAKPIPTQPRTAGQQRVRGQFGSTSSRYKGLTEEQRAAWIALGSDMRIVDTLGQGSTMSGAQCHSSVNGNLAVIGTEYQGNAPAASSPDILPEFTLTANRNGTTTGPLSIQLTASSAYTTSNVAVFSSKAVSAGINYFGKGAYAIITVEGSLPVSAVDLAPGFVAKYGPAPVGSKISIKLIPIDASGFAGPPVTKSCIVTLSASLAARRPARAGRAAAAPETPETPPVA